MTLDFTTVVGVDSAHLAQLELTWPTWRKHKPDLLDHPMVIFYDAEQVAPAAIIKVVKHRHLTTVAWPPVDARYEGGEGKWMNAQRYKMLAGHVYIPAHHVETAYWLKIDTDTVATGCPDWIDSKWFDGNPAIVSQPWGFTKPPWQMQFLDEWAEQHQLFTTPPLGLSPFPGAGRLKHRRIISWVGFFNARLARLAVDLASASCPFGELPVRSQDGFHWYMAKRMNWEIRTVNFKALGWEHHSRTKMIRGAARRAME